MLVYRFESFTLQLFADFGKISAWARPGEFICPFYGRQPSHLVHTPSRHPRIEGAFLPILPMRSD
jgi:hypothetical protein